MRMRSQVLKVFVFTALPVAVVFGCGGVPGAALAASQIPTAGLVAYYPFNGNTNDASGNGFHCTSHGAVLTSDRSRTPNSAYRFDGVDDYIECPNSPRLGVHVGVDMTVSTWVKPTRLSPAPFIAQQIISKYRYFVPENSDFYVALNLNADETVQPKTITVTGMGFDVVTGDPPRLNKWSHIAVVFRGTVGDASVYLNGKLVGTGTLTYNPVPGPENLWIGSAHAPSDEQPEFAGSIDDVRLYERALSGKEVKALAHERPSLLNVNDRVTSTTPVLVFGFTARPSLLNVNDRVTLAPDVNTAFDPTPMPEAPAGTFTITATFTNTSDTSLRFPFFTVTELSGGNLLLNGDEGAQGIGAMLTPDIGDDIFAPGASITVDFVIGLQGRERFTFFVDLLAYPE
jgi:Concanavalin A-like lectin/glucanases superfamily